MIYKLNNYLKHELVSNIIHTYSSRIILIILGLVSNVVITRALGVEEYGEYIFLMTVVVTGMQFGSFGLHSANIYYVAQRRSFVGMLFKNSIMFALVSGLMMSLIIVCINHFFPNAFNFDLLQILLISLLIIFSLISLFIRNLLIGIGEIKKDNNIAMKIRLISLSLVFIAIVFFDFSIDIAIYIYAISLILTIYFVWKILYPYLIKSYPNKLSIKFFKKMSKFGTKAYISGLLAYLVFKSDLYFVNYYLSASELGYYSLAVSFIDYIYILPTIVGTILFQKLSSITSEEEKLYLLRSVISYFTVAYLVFLGFIYFISDPLIMALYGREFSNSISIIKLLLIAIFFMGYQTIEVQYLVSMGYPKQIIFYWLFAFILNFILNFILIEEYMLEGVVFSTIISYFIVFLFIKIKVFQYVNSK